MLYETAEGRVTPRKCYGTVRFYDFETTENTLYTDEAKLDVPNFVCVQQFSSRIVDVEDGDCVRCGKRKHSFWEHHVGDFLSYLIQPCTWANMFVAIAHNAKAFDLHFILYKRIGTFNMSKS